MNLSKNQLCYLMNLNPKKFKEEDKLLLSWYYEKANTTKLDTKSAEDIREGWTKRSLKKLYNSVRGKDKRP